MTTLKPVSLSAMEIGSVDNSSGGNDIASQITRLTKQITKVTQQLKEVAMGDAEEKQKQQELLESQLAMLQAQLAQLQRQQAEEAMPKQEKVRQSRKASISLRRTSDKYLRLIIGFVKSGSRVRPPSNVRPAYAPHPSRHAPRRKETCFTAYQHQLAFDTGYETLHG